MPNRQSTGSDKGTYDKSDPTNKNQSKPEQQGSEQPNQQGPLRQGEGPNPPRSGKVGSGSAGNA